MPVQTYRSKLDTTPDETYAWHARPGALERLNPPGSGIRVLQSSQGLGDKGRNGFELRKGLFRLHWTTLYRDIEPGHLFREIQDRGPFRRWVATHRFLPGKAGGCLLEETLDYELPTALQRLPWARGGIAATLERAFRLRHERLRHDLARHHRYIEHGHQQVVVSGAGGLVGRRLCAYLASAGHEVRRLVRRPALPGSGDITWYPVRGMIDAAALEGVDVVVHLAGENIAAGRWTPQRKDTIRSSRADGTRLLCQALAGLHRKPRVLIAASAVGYYGDRGEDGLEETAPPGRGFLAEVCQAWEAATAPAQAAGIRVVNLRVGVVLASEGGALPRLLTPFRLGMGGPAGSGRQFMSWIALEDLLGAVEHLMFTASVQGPVNATAPRPVSNAAFAHELGKVLHRPALLPLPALALRAILGEMGQALLLEGQRAYPTRLLASGFAFLYPELEAALRGELGL